jgi:hypothetical protein
MPLTKIQSLGITDGTIVNADINASAAIAGTKLSGVGKVLQVVQATKTDTFSTSTASYTDITGLSVSITPSSASNKVLILAQISYGGESNLYAHGRIVRGSTSIFQGDSDSASRTECTVAMSLINGNASNVDKSGNASIVYLDSPSTTSATTYKIQVNSASSQSFRINRTEADNDGVYTSRPTSSIIVMEIAG